MLRQANLEAGSAMEAPQREAMEFDVVIVGAGPSGLAAAIRLKQLAAERGREVSVCVIEKGSEVGAHILSGAVIDPIALDELIPDWRDKGAPLVTPVTDDRFLILSGRGSLRIPAWMLPPLMSNHGNYIVSLGNVCRWLAQQAEALGVEIFPGFAAAEVLFDEEGAVRGVATGDLGIARDGTPKASHTPGVELHAKYTFFAEGARGSLTKQLVERFALRDGIGPQKFGLGVKELWQVDPARHKPGLVCTARLAARFDDRRRLVPLPSRGQPGGGGLRRPPQLPEPASVAVRGVPALQDPSGDPADLRGRQAAGLRRAGDQRGRPAIGAEADLPRRLPDRLRRRVRQPAADQGSHNAMKTGMLAAEAAFDALAAGEGGSRLLAAYPEAFARSWAWRDLYKVRNVKPGLRWGLWLGTLHGGLHMWLNDLGLGFLVPWTMKHGKADHETLKPAAAAPPIVYPKPDGAVSFDLLSSVFLSNTNHEEDQPVHLRLKDPAIAIDVNLTLYDAPEQRYCPAGVYEIVAGEGGRPRLQINAQNCVHCKTCDIKDPRQNIDWVVPEGGGGPNYPNM